MIERADVMVGPRGRRLCLEIAAALARASGAPEGDEYLRAALVAAYHLDPGAGTARVILRASADEPDEPDPSPRPADVARLLSATPLDGLDADVLLVGLRAAVDNARYWQEPDGEDVLAATPQVRAALARVAATVASSGRAAWWVSPVERTAQASVVFDDPASPVQPSDETASVILSRWRDRTLEEEARAQRERPADPGAAWSGTWWSTPPRELTRTTRRLGAHGPVGLWLVEDAYGWDRASVRAVDVPAEARVYEVDGAEAWSGLCRRFPLEVTASRRHDWFRTTGAADRWVIPDWVRVADEFDAVHVTVTGYLTTAGRPVPVGEDTSSVLAGWSPDETYWLADPPPAAEPHERWRRVDDDTWHDEGMHDRGGGLRAGAG
ncbi:hypothetical protein [Cellulomonas terrae]|uniref:Uncharacterized protein n=1 Tax=Cellulomonas terrae TaxID=311234 RepID=A0A511JJS4_9CELL|nr:hypothetical protein [Cellulomonas terrae]GEL98155.1 hypothetical protein CTE05_17020 [Cellulomonas terrae]